MLGRRKEVCVYVKVTMSQLYLANCQKLISQKHNGSTEWADIHKFVNVNVSLIDRSQATKLPYDFRVYDKFALPKDITKSSLTYEECCERKATELYELSKKTDLPLYVFYSGGIDSTLVLISFLKVIPEADRGRLVVVLSLDSIREYPEFYANHIRGKLQIVSSENMSIFFNKKCIIVGGEHNDQLMGTDVLSDMQSKISFETAFQPYTKDNIMAYFKEHGMTDESSALWYDIVHDNAQKAPCEIKTVHNFFWWLNFNFKWQSVFFRMLLRVDKNFRHLIDQEFVDTHFHHFYSDDYFQIWAMQNMHLKIKDTWNSYKWHAKDVIYNFTGDEDYRNNKQKANSLHKLFIAKETPVALTSDYEYLYKLDLDEYYVSENDFMR